jgi:predicted transglutaminase-like cysteine proteinase
MLHRAFKTTLAAVLSASLFSLIPTHSFAASAAPLGFQLFCLQQPQHCRGGGKAQVELSAEVLQRIRQINSQVNRSIRPRNDAGGDVWTLGATSGDCEDYVLSKRQALINAGFPPSALRFAHVRTGSGIDHAILIVKTDSQDLVLDNLVSDVVPTSQMGYRVLAVSSADPRVWTP